jgi:meiotically up-regulated gene 157 (Mug157) protein
MHESVSISVRGEYTRSWFAVRTRYCNSQGAYSDVWLDVWGVLVGGQSSALATVDKYLSVDSKCV